MVLTPTRTRTQTTLTKLSQMVAEVHGELAFVEALIAEGNAAVDDLALLERRREDLIANRDALYATIRQFDSTIDPAVMIGSSDAWRKRVMC